MRTILVTSTGTNIGKTYITCGLIKALKLKYKVHGIKPIISGWQYDENTDNTNNDTINIIKALGLDINANIINKISPYRYKEPITPDIAAKKEGKVISFDQVQEFCKVSIETSGADYIFIEGAGGVMVPIWDVYTYLDIAYNLNLELILVVGTYLGTLSHTITALEVIRQKQLNLIKVIINESEEMQATPQDLKEVISRFTNTDIEFVYRGQGLGVII